MPTTSANLKRAFFLHSEEIRANAISFLSMVPADGSAEVLIHPIKSKVSAAQRGLYWGVWLPEIKRWENSNANTQGKTADDLHNDFKRTFMARIYLEGADTRTQKEWLDAYDLARELGAEPDQLNKVKRLVSTEWATKGQYAKYLTSIEQFCFSRGLTLSHPDDRYDEALKAA